MIIYTLIFYIIIPALLVYVFITSFLTLIKRRKQFKNILKISKDHKIRDIIQIIIHLIIYIFIIITIFTVLKGDNNSCPKNTKIITSKTVASLNAALALEYKLTNTKVSDLENREELQDLFKRRLHTTDKIKLPKKYRNHIHFQTNDGIIYSIIKFEKGCNTIDIHNPLNSSCVIEFDINGAGKPNKLNIDIFQAIIDGENLQIFLLN